ETPVKRSQIGKCEYLSSAKYHAHSRRWPFFTDEMLVSWTEADRWGVVLIIVRNYGPPAGDESRIV
ncbi:MAG TPA: hypothetical protein VFO41_13410, partial [Alphaproteobacteria bacterium]|nr:hypothetical protein [Alphaproteobacteria bacterium]